MPGQVDGHAAGRHQRPTPHRTPQIGQPQREMPRRGQGDLVQARLRRLPVSLGQDIAGPRQVDRLVVEPSRHRQLQQSAGQFGHRAGKPLGQHLGHRLGQFDISAARPTAAARPGGPRARAAPTGSSARPSTGSARPATCRATRPAPPRPSPPPSAPRPARRRACGSTPPGR